jgi:hypothetical protein
MILIGFVLCVIGVLIPFLNVLQLMHATFFTSFLSFAASTSGLFLGIIGAATFARRGRNRK